jgi:hypothetical protein
MRLIGELGLEHHRAAFRDHVMLPFEELRGACSINDEAATAAFY